MLKKRIWLISALLLTVLSLVTEIFFMHHDPAHSHWWDTIPGFYILFGFLGCILIILFAKSLGKYFLDRKEDYYDAH